MHDDEVAIDAALVRRLVISQHPELLCSEVQPVISSGTDNALYLIGGGLAARLPRTPEAATYLLKENQWLPVLRSHLTIPVPAPLAVGQPGEGFPFQWSIVPWLDGQPPEPNDLADPVGFAIDLATFVRALQSVEVTGGPHDVRGESVKLSDARVRMGIANLRDELDPTSVTAAWDRVMEVPDHVGDPVWFHGDLSPTNVLVSDGSLSAVIDWGRCGVGDPAIDTTVGWALLPPKARDAYREALAVDDATWERGKGWVLGGVVGIAYYRKSRPDLVEGITRTIRALLAD